MQQEFDFSEDINTTVENHTLVFIYDSICKDYVYKNGDPEPFLKQLVNIVPKEHEFFEAWLIGFISVARNDRIKAKEFYSAALSKAELAMDYLPIFLQQGFAFFMYIDEAEKAKQFWEFGVTHNVFMGAGEKFFETFNAKEQFWVQFAPNMCIDRQKATERALSDYKKHTSSALEESIDDADFEHFSNLVDSIDFNTEKINSVSVLYYTLQRRAAIRAGAESFIEDLVQTQTARLLSKIDFSKLPEQQRNDRYMTIFHQMRITYDKSGLGKIMYNAFFGKDNELAGRLKNLEKISEIIIDRTDDVDDFSKQIDGKLGSNALLFAAETNDWEICKKLIKKNANTDKIIGAAPFGLKYSDGSVVSTSIPNSFIYRLISFGSWTCLKKYLSEFADKAKKSMTERSDKFNITPLVYCILNTIYNAKDEEERTKSKALVDELLPFFLNAGAVLEENTAFGTARSLLGKNNTSA